MPQEQRETFLVIREPMEIVTIIETLSPANRRGSSDGRQQYIAKREEIFRSRTDVYEWSIRQPLPEIPMKKHEPEVRLNLQEVFKTVYQRARYQLSVDYRTPLDTPLPEAEAAWVRSFHANRYFGRLGAAPRTGDSDPLSY